MHNVCATKKKEKESSCYLPKSADFYEQVVVFWGEMFTPTFTTYVKGPKMEGQKWGKLWVWEWRKSKKGGGGEFGMITTNFRKG